MRRGLNFYELQTFKTVMEIGSTTKAATALNTTQPSVSRRLADLQRATGLQLFDLYRGRLRPTREGRRLYHSVCRHFDGLEKIETAVRLLRASGEGRLRIGSTPTLASGFLPPFIARFLEQYPRTSINLQTLSTPQLEEHLRQELIDLAFTTGEANAELFDIAEIASDQAVCVLPRDHPLAGRDWIALASLNKHRVVLLDSADSLTVRLRRLLGDARFPNDIAIETNSSITICALVSAGIGIGVVNPYVANTFGERFIIKPLRPSVEVRVQLAQSAAVAPCLDAQRFVALVARPTGSSVGKRRS
jgi:DNA-binding transcriptional LysR family regulator